MLIVLSKTAYNVPLILFFKARPSRMVSPDPAVHPRKSYTKYDFGEIFNLSFRTIIWSKSEIFMLRSFLQTQAIRCGSVMFLVVCNLLQQLQRLFW